MFCTGGVRQQLASLKRSASVVEGNTDQPTPDGFLHGLFKKGKISATMVQQGSAAMLNRTSESDDRLRTWASIGAAGEHPQNCHRDLVQKMSKDTKLPQLYVADTWYWDPVASTRIKGEMYFLLPFEVWTDTEFPTTQQIIIGSPD